MDRLSDSDPFLQIIHISDLHLVDASYDYAGWLKSVMWLDNDVYPALYDLLINGTATHDPNCLLEFEDFLKELTIRDPEWNLRKTWIVDTGDITTFGDDASFKLGHDTLERWRKIANAELLRLHGNHDAWPSKIPFRATEEERNEHRALLRRNWYTQRWAEAPLRCAIPNANADVLLFGLNSVLHERLRNSVALGEVKEDRYWEQHVPVAKDNVQIERLRANLGQRRSFRIVAVHHPIYFPDPNRMEKNKRTMVMVNSEEVAKSLGSSALYGSVPLAHLVLSGHTHNIFPKHKNLPSTIRRCHHPPLSESQCQLIVGSLAQHDYSQKRSKWSQQCQVLRFYAPRRRQDALVMERLLAARSNECGSYKFVDAGSGQDPAEELIAHY
jgi:predicted phosphodiesterase